MPLFWANLVNYIFDKVIINNTGNYLICFIIRKLNLINSWNFLLLIPTATHNIPQQSYIITQLLQSTTQTAIQNNTQISWHIVIQMFDILSLNIILLKDNTYWRYWHSISAYKHKYSTKFSHNIIKICFYFSIS